MIDGREVECFYGDHDYGGGWSPNCRSCGHVDRYLLSYLGVRGKYAKRYQVAPELVERWWIARDLKSAIGMGDLSVASAVEILEPA